jgi:hypothetical protein
MTPLKVRDLRLTQTQNAYVLLDAVEAPLYQDQEPPQAGNLPETNSGRWAQQERTMETRTYTGNPDRYGQQVL